MKNILRSRILTGVLISIVVLSGVLAAVMKNPAEKSYREYDPAELAGGSAETVIPIKNYNFLKIYDGEKGLFLCGKEDNENEYMLIDEEGNTVRTYTTEGTVYDICGKYAVTADSSDYAGILINLEDGSVLEKGIVEDWNNNTGDFLIRKNEELSVMNQKGKIIYSTSLKTVEQEENDDRLYYPEFADDDYINVFNEDKTADLINIRTGETVYHTGENEGVLKKEGDKWVVYQQNEDGTSVYSFLNEDFTEAFEGKKCLNYKASDGYFAFSELLEDGMDNKDKVYCPDGSEFNISRYGYQVRGFADNMVLVGKGTSLVNYVNLEGPDKGKSAYKSSDACERKFYNGMAPACKSTINEVYAETGIPEEEKSGTGLEWGFVDKNLNHVTDFAFDYVSDIENGYAVVGKYRHYNMHYGVIRLDGGK